MAIDPIAPRHRLAVHALGLTGSEAVLEIGCGHGVATRLALQNLPHGSLTALDRSARMIDMVAKASAADLASGRLHLRAEALEKADWGNARFDAIFAVNVDLERRLADRWVPLIDTLLAPRGRLVLAFDPPPGSDKASGLAESIRTRLDTIGLKSERQSHPGGIVIVRATRPN